MNYVAVPSLEALLTTLTHPSFARLHLADGMWLMLKSSPCVQIQFCNGFEQRAWDEAMAERYPTYMVKIHAWS